MDRQRFDRERNLYSISSKAGLELPYGNRYDQFFDFLKLSQSYRLADRYRKGLIKKRQEKLPEDFKKVLKTYDAFGDVTQISLEQWWTEKAQFQFSIRTQPRGSLLMTLNARETASRLKLKEANVALRRYLDEDRPSQDNRAVLLLILPVHWNRMVMTYEFDRLLNQSGIPLKEPKEIYPFRLLANKIRADMIHNAHRVTLYRASNPNKTLLEIGMETGISPANNIDDRTKAWQYDKKRRNLESMTSRLLRKAYCLSENAARGEFPSLKPSPGTETTFDWNVLGKQFAEYLFRDAPPPMNSKI